MTLIIHSRTFVQSKPRRYSDVLTHKLAFSFIYMRTFSATTKIFMDFEVFAMITGYDHSLRPDSAYTVFERIRNKTNLIKNSIEDELWGP